VILLLGACSFGLTDLDGHVPGGQDVALSIADIEPSWGLPDDDTEVTITGDKIGGAMEVYFGYQSVSFTRIDATTIVATAPGPGFETTVDVRVVGDAGTDTVTDGFRYTEDGGDTETDTDTDTDADTDTDTSGAGKTGGYIELSLVQYTCPQCYKDPPNETDVYAIGLFHAPKSASWLDWMPAEGECVQDPTFSSAANSFQDAGSRIYLDSGSRSIAMQADADNVYSALDLSASDYVRNAGYDLSVSTGGDIEAFDVTDVMTTPEALSSVTPAELLLTSDRDLFTARIAKSNAAFTWSPSGGSGSFAVGLDVYDGGTGSYLGSVVCLGPDNGRLTIPSSQLPYPAGSLVFVNMYRYNIDSFERPDNSSSVETLVRLGVQGTGSLF
jgi:hypothetical protein